LLEVAPYGLVDRYWRSRSLLSPSDILKKALMGVTGT
jgi:hypothetical protein